MDLVRRLKRLGKLVQDAFGNSEGMVKQALRNPWSSRSQSRDEVPRRFQWVWRIAIRNPEGIPSSSPRLRRPRRYLGFRRGGRATSTRLRSEVVTEAARPQRRWRLGSIRPFPQGSLVPLARSDPGLEDATSSRLIGESARWIGPTEHPNCGHPLKSSRNSGRQSPPPWGNPQRTSPETSRRWGVGPGLGQSPGRSRANSLIS